VTDAEGPEGKFGEERVLALVREARGRGSDAAVNAVFEALEAFNGGNRDDRSVLVLNA
jgi:serine phosphatase RsbU (regulator of sigma subunit)